MKKISKAQKFFIEKHSPATFVGMSSREKKSKRKRYTVEETPETERLLERFDNEVERVVEKHGLFVEHGKRIRYD